MDASMRPSLTSAWSLTTITSDGWCTAMAVDSLMARFSSASVAATAISVITVFRGWGWSSSGTCACAKFAQAQVPDDDHPHPRNTVMTLIAVAATEAEEKRAIRESTAIAVHHPSLVIVVRDQAEVKEGRIDASIAAPLVPAEGGADLS